MKDCEDRNGYFVWIKERVEVVEWEGRWEILFGGWDDKGSGWFVDCGKGDKIFEVWVL